MVVKSSYRFISAISSCSLSATGLTGASLRPRSASARPTSVREDRVLRLERIERAETKDGAYEWRLLFGGLDEVLSRPFMASWELEEMRFTLCFRNGGMFNLKPT